MKSKTLAITTVALITAAAFILTAGLSLLNGSAVGEALISSESALPDASEAVVTELPEVDPDAGVPAEDQPENGVIADDMPMLDAEGIDESGDNAQEDGNGRDEILDRDAFDGVIAIDIYAQSTAEYVGQVIIDSEEAYSRLEELFYEYAENRTYLFDPNYGTVSSEHWLPKAKYRIEVMAGSIFAYSYGVENNTVMESLQSGVTFAGGDEVIAFIDSLIADEIDAIENGINKKPNPQNAIVEVEKLLQYWCGGYNEVLGTDLPAHGRKTPRFPYKQGANEEGLYDMVLVDVYEHSTGKLVGRIDLSTTKNFNAVHEAADVYFNGAISSNDPDYADREQCVLPNADYRIEIFAFTANEFGGYRDGLFLAYSYNLGEGAVGDKFELVQIGMSFNGGAQLTAALDALIEAGMQDISAGNGVIPEIAASALSRCEDCWKVNGRYSERFPYISE